MKTEGIRIKGYEGTWYIIDTAIIEGKKLALLESEVWGDEVPCIIIDTITKKVLYDDIMNGWDDYYYAIGIY